MTDTTPATEAGRRHDPATPTGQRLLSQTIAMGYGLSFEADILAIEAEARAASDVFHYGQEQAAVKRALREVTERVRALSFPGPSTNEYWLSTIKDAVLAILTEQER